MPGSRWIWGIGCAAGLSVLLVSVTFACGGEPPVPERPRSVFGEHRFSRAAIASKTLGQRCASGGASECVEGVCLHYGPDPQSKYACSRACRADSECGGLEGWRCQSIWPGSGGAYCVPPASWEAP